MEGQERSNAPERGMISNDIYIVFEASNASGIKGKKLLVIGTTSRVSFLDSVDLCDAFSVTYHVPTLNTEDAKKVLEQLKVFSEDDVDAAAEALNNTLIKKLYMLIEMAAQGEHGGAAEAIYSGREKIKISHFYDCLQDVIRY